MFTFPQFYESNLAPLYHGTSLENVHSILKNGHIKPSNNGYTSTTRSKKYVENGYGQEAYFHLDQEKIRHNHKVVPNDFHSDSKRGGAVPSPYHTPGLSTSDVFDPKTHRRREAEEAVKGHIPLKHVKELVVHKKKWDEFAGPETDLEKEAAHHIKTKSDTAWAYKGMTHKDRMRAVNSFHKQLKKHNIKLTVKHY